jgi:hypothetical protein
MAKVAREIDRITALEVTMSPERTELATPADGRPPDTLGH